MNLIKKKKKKKKKNNFLKKKKKKKIRISKFISAELQTRKESF